MKHIFNAHALVSVKIVDKKIHPLWEWLPFKKGFWSNRKEGFYYILSHSLFTNTLAYTDRVISYEEIVEKGFLVEGTAAYYKPYAKLTFTNGQTYTKEFNTYEEAMTWGREQANIGIQVRLEF